MFLDLLGKLPRVLSALRKPHNRISLLPPTRIPLRSPFTISSRNTFYYLTTRPGITASPLHLPCVSPASCVLVSSLLCPASSCILLRSPRVPPHHLVSASCVLCGLIVSRMFCRFLGPERVYSPPCVYLPSLRLSSLVFRSSAPRSVIRSIPPFSFPFRMFSSEATSSRDFLSPRPLFFPPFPQVSASDPPSFHRHHCCLPQYLQSFPGVLPPFVALKAVVCFSSPLRLPTVATECPPRGGLVFIYKSVLVTLNQ